MIYFEKVEDCFRLKPPVSANNEKSAQREMQTLHAGCSKVEPKNFAPLQNPFPAGGAGRPKFDHLQMLPYKPSLLRIDARNFELSW